MADTYTTNLNLTKPEPGAAEDTWGISLNSDLDALDAIFSSSGTQVNLNPNQVNFADNKKAIFGTGSDFLLFHDGSNSFIKDEGTGHLNITTNGTDIRLQKNTGEYMAKFIPDGAVELYYDNSKKLETTSSGIDVTGNATFNDNDKAIFGTGGDLEIYHDGTNTYLKNNTGDLYLRQNANDKDVLIQSDNGSGGLNTYFRADGSTGETKLYNYGALKLTTKSDGIDVSGVASTTFGVNIIDPGNTAYGGHLSYDDANSKILIGGVTNNTKNAAITINRDNNYVGIGTTAPSQPLNVESSVDYVANFKSTDTTAGILLTDSNATCRVTNSNGNLCFNADINNQQANSAIRFLIDDSTNSGANATMVLRSTGLGIGTASPSHKLTVEGTTSHTTARVKTTTGNANLRVSTNNSDFAIIGQGGSNRLDIYDNNASSTRLSLDSNGNVYKHLITSRKTNSIRQSKHYR